ncbi:MAG TPA: hypothetical protein VGQ64_03090 [Candidatus Limnocylindrales bacterium]|jgi:hypothetical protein|nr:hypothetical protein [Candidatus Limnocylindrales bacterium]
MTEPRRPTGRRGTTVGSITGLSKDERLAELEARLQRLERSPSLRARGRSVMDKVMPPEASEHFRNAGREQLLGVRSIVDFWIRRLDEADSRAAGRTRERETIEID